MNKYLKYTVMFSQILDICREHKFNRINYYIDFQSICTGLYNKDNILFELSYYVKNEKNISETLINEYKNFLNSIYLKTCPIQSFFITFYDDGYNRQNTSINSDYKHGRSTIRNILYDDEELQLYKLIKELYYQKIENRFTNSYGKVYYLHDYESDLIPYYCISYNKFSALDQTTLNVILSNDKDLLQCCQLNNTIQQTSRYFKTQTKSKLKTDLYDNYNALSYIYNNFKPGIITAKYIPLILAISGDTSDNIKGIRGLGTAKTIKLITDYNIPSTPWEIEQYNNTPQIIKNNMEIISRNYKITSFDEQLKRTNLIKYE